jgi:protein JSN1
VLKVINQRNEPEARDTILKALFFSSGDQVLEEILSDHSCGATLIFKVLTTPFFEETMRSEVVQNVRNVLLRLKATPSQGYKRLMDEVGLSTRNGAPNNTSISNGPKDHPRDGVNGNPNANNDRRGVSHHNSPGNNNHNHHNANRDIPPVSFYTVPPSFDSVTIAAAAAAAAQQMPQNGMFDPTMRAFEQLNLGPGSLYGSPGPPGLGNPALQYQALLQQSMARPGAGFFGIPPPMANYNSGPASQDQYRTSHPGGSPVPQPQQMVNNPMLAGMGAGPGVFNPLVAQQLMAGYPYPMVFQPPQPQGNGAGSGRRGGRVSYS